MHCHAGHLVGQNVYVHHCVILASALILRSNFVFLFDDFLTSFSRTVLSESLVRFTDVITLQ